MLTFLGVVSMMGSGWLGFVVGTMTVRSGGWWVTLIYTTLVTGMVACLALAYLCFGGEF